MDKEKQIEEMANIFDKVDRENADNTVRDMYEDYAKEIYNAGYRKTFISSLSTNEQKAYKEGYNKGIAEMTQEVACANDELDRQWLTSISLEAHNHEINELKAENERLTKEIARLGNRLLAFELKEQDK